MLPNWLYGKSKSKLASILGGGGGIPEDYNQVKAQVNQNTEDIALHDSQIDTLANNVNVLIENGAMNLLPINNTTRTINGVTFTINSNRTITLNGANTTTSAFVYELAAVGDNFVLPAGSYKLTGCPSDGSDRTWRLQAYKPDGITVVALDVGEGAVFTLSEDTQLRVTIRVGGSAGSGTITDVIFKPMISPASLDLSYDDYHPYAMTNRELTEKLTANANLDTAVDLSTYTAYSNLYTAPSDGYVHFLSEASGSTARTIYTYGNNTTAAADPHFTHSTSANNKAFEIYIRKGLKVYVDGLSSGDTINFYPLT